MITEYVIKKGDSFHGVPYDVMKDGIVQWSGKSRAEYETDDYEILHEVAFHKKLEEYFADTCGKWIEISKERYEEMLNVLPPLKWTRGGFFLSEGYTLDIYLFHQEYFGRYYQAYFRINTPRDEILKSLDEFTFIRAREKAKETA